MLWWLRLVSPPCFRSVVFLVYWHHAVTNWAKLNFSRALQLCRRWERQRDAGSLPTTVWGQYRNLNGNLCFKPSNEWLKKWSASTSGIHLQHNLGSGAAGVLNHSHMNHYHSAGSSPRHTPCIRSKWCTFISLYLQLMKWLETFIAYKLYMSTHHTNKLFPVSAFHFLLNQKVYCIWDRFRSLCWFPSPGPV